MSPNYLKYRIIFENIDNHCIFANDESDCKKNLVAFYTEHPDARTALEEWYEKTNRTEWENFSQVKRTFNSADFVGNNRIVFNIRGNQYRLVALVLFRNQMVFIRFIGTHRDYDTIKDIENI